MNFAYAIGRNIFPHKGLKIPNKLEETLKKIKKVLIGLTIGDGVLSTGTLLTGVFIVLGGTLLNLFAFGIALKVAAVALFVIATLFFASTIFGIVKIAIKNKKIPPKKPDNKDELKTPKKVEIPEEIQNASDEKLIENYNNKIIDLETLLTYLRPRPVSMQSDQKTDYSIDDTSIKDCEEHLNDMEFLVEEIIKRIGKNKKNSKVLKNNFSNENISIFHAVYDITLRIIEEVDRTSNKRHEIIGKGFSILLDILKYCSLNKSVERKDGNWQEVNGDLAKEVLEKCSNWLTNFPQEKETEAEIYKKANLEKFKEKFRNLPKDLSLLTLNLSIWK